MSIVNFYKLLPKELNNKYHNPNYKKIFISHPFRMIVCSYSGGGKTNFILNLIYNTPSTFGKIVICTKNKDEPLYNFLEEKIKDGLTIVEGIDNIPNLDEFDKNEQSLVIFDDLVLEKNQKLIAEYYIRCRKLNCSVAYLSQSFFGIPKVIRGNANYIVLKKLANLRDINLLISEYNLGIDKDKMISMYKKATSEQDNFMIIDAGADDEHKFRIGWNEFINTKQL
jgi:hypothetical protein